MKQVHLRFRSCAAAGLLALILAAPAAGADPPESYIGARESVSDQIDRNIERYRKGDATIEIAGADGRPLSGAALEICQKTHAYLFGCNWFALGQLATPELNRKQV